MLEGFPGVDNALEDVSHDKLHENTIKTLASKSWKPKTHNNNQSYHIKGEI